MKFIEKPELNRLNVLLEHIDIGDRILKGRLELFDTSAKLDTERHLSETVDKELNHSPKWLAHSPLGPLQRQDVKELLVNLISSMNQCFPDYDFSTLSPAQFHHEEDFVEVYDNVQSSLWVTVERIMPGLLHEVWSSIRKCVNLREVEVYSYVAEKGTDADPFSESDCLFSFDYFFYDKKQNRILFFSCMTRSKFTRTVSDSECDEDEDCDEYEQFDDIEGEDYNEEDPMSTPSNMMNVKTTSPDASQWT